MLVVHYVWRSLVARIRANTITMLSVTLFVIGASLGLSFYSGLKAMLVETAPPENVIVLSRGAASEAGSKLSLDTARKIALLPGIKKDGNVPLAARELVTRVQLGAAGYTTIRGIDDTSAKIDHITMVQGQLPARDSLDIIIGRRVAAQHPKLAIGTEIHLPAGPAKITGIFAANNGPFEDEVWTPRPALEAHVKTKVSTSVTFAADDAAHVPELVQTINNSRDLQAQALTVAKFREGTTGFQTIARTVFVLLVLLSVVATSAIATTMQAAATSRVPELAALAAIGIRRSHLAWLVVFESMLLAVIGAVLGVAITALVSRQLGEIRLGANPVDVTTSFGIPAIGILLGVIVGAVGGLSPALIVRRLDITEALR